LVPVPKLGELRQLPQVDESLGGATQAGEPTSGLSGGRSLIFAALSLIGVMGLLGAGFCAINWATIEVPTTTEDHISGLKAAYQEVTSAQLIREWEDITEYGVDLPVPYQYRTIELRKQAWGHKALGFLAAAGLALIVAFLIGRSRTPSSA